MRMWNILRKMVMVLAVSFCLSKAMVPAIAAYAAAPTPTAVESQAADASSTQAGDDDGSFLLIMGGGLLLIILFAVIAAVSSVSAAVAIAANMDLDGE